MKKGIFYGVIILSILFLFVALFPIHLSEKQTDKLHFSPEQASNILLEIYPQSKVVDIRLEQSNNGDYMYSILFLNDDQKQVADIDVTDGTIISIHTVSDLEETQFFTIEDALKTIQKEYPSGQLIEVSLEEINQVFYYEIELIFEQYYYNIFIDPLSGSIIKQEKQHKAPYINFAQWMTFTSAYQEILNYIPNTFVLTLELNFDNVQPTYESTVIDILQEHQICLDAANGTLVNYQTNSYDQKSYPQQLQLLLQTTPTIDDFPE